MLRTVLWFVVLTWAGEKGVSPFSLGPKPSCTICAIHPKAGEVCLNLRFTRSAPLFWLSCRLVRKDWSEDEGQSLSFGCPRSVFCVKLSSGGVRVDTHIKSME